MPVALFVACVPVLRLTRLPPGGVCATLTEGVCHLIQAPGRDTLQLTRKQDDRDDRSKKRETEKPPASGMREERAESPQQPNHANGDRIPHRHRTRTARIRSRPDERRDRTDCDKAGGRDKKNSEKLPSKRSPNKPPRKDERGNEEHCGKQQAIEQRTRTHTLTVGDVDPKEPNATGKGCRVPEAPGRER